MDETVEWYNSFVLVPKSNGKIRLCLDPARLNQALIRLVHRGPTHNDILLKLNNAQYLSLTDVSSGYQNLKLMRNHHTSQHLHASLADTDTRDCHFEQPLQKIFPKKNR